MPDVTPRIRVCVTWIDWYPYHVARFRGLAQNPALDGHVAGIELVGGIGVHAGLKFRESLPAELPIHTLLPNDSWAATGKVRLALLLWKQLTRLSPDVVLVPGYYTLPGIACALWARIHGATSVLMTESTAYDHPRVAWKEWLKSLGLHLLFDWAITGGRDHAEYLRQLHFPATRIVGSYDVVDNDLFAAARTLRSPDATPSFLYVGRLAEEKNVHTLLNAWLCYRAHGGVWPLVLVGDGPQAAALKALAAASPYAGEIHFPGLRTARELLPFYAAAGCFVLPSTREPWGLVVNEAMAAGLPVLVSSRCGCASELVAPGVNGFTFQPQDIAGLATHLHTIATLSPAARAAMGDASAQRIARFTLAGFGDAIAAIVAHRRHPHGAPDSNLTPAGASR